MHYGQGANGALYGLSSACQVSVSVVLLYAMHVCWVSCALNPWAAGKGMSVSTNCFHTVTLRMYGAVLYRQFALCSGVSGVVTTAICPEGTAIKRFMCD